MIELRGFAYGQRVFLDSQSRGMRRLMDGRRDFGSESDLDFPQPVGAYQFPIPRFAASMGWGRRPGSFRERK